MCGIAGYFGAAGSRGSLERMTRALIRRGPDDEGFYVHQAAGLGFRRLSILDLNDGHQPMTNEDASVWAILNGEIYNFIELRQTLLSLGHRFATESDTEVLVHGYESWGDDLFHRLRGMFAIGMYDGKRDRLLLARDPLGKKPLYWMVRRQTLFFASELKSLLAAGLVSRALSSSALVHYFRTDAIPTPETIFQDVFKLNPGTAMAWNVNGEEKRWRYYSCPQESASEYQNADGIIKELRLRIDEAVCLRLRSDVPLGVFLSGGLDSSVIAESAARQSTQAVKAFTIGFEEMTYDERPVARMLASAFGMHLEEAILTSNEALAMLDQAVEAFDEPLADPSVLPQLFLAMFARKQITVALSGDGGDELLLGYQHVNAHQWMNRLTHAPRFVERVLADMLCRVPSSTEYFSAGFIAQRFARGLDVRDPWSRDVAWRGSFTDGGLRALFRPEVSAALPSSVADEGLRRWVNDAPHGDFWKQWTWAYLHSFLMDEVMVKVDRATMWFSLESRAPLLDTRVVSYLLNVPSTYKLGAWKGKRLFRELLKEKIPAVALRTKKHGFTIPVAKWLNGVLAERLDSLCDPLFLDRQGLFSFATIDQLRNEHRSGKQDRRKELWALLIFQLWYQRWMQSPL